MNKVIIISGGSGAGKTTLAKKIVEALGNSKFCILSQDHYYHDQSAKFDGDGGTVNFDHPNSLDFELLATHARNLKDNQPIEVPVYDFASHKRLKKTTHLKPAPIIIIEGTLLLSQESVRIHADEKIFIEIPENIRFERRLKRDTQERGREPEGVRKQFFNQVKPMHDQFVETSKKYATFVVLNDDYNGCIKYLKQKFHEIF